MQTVETLNEGLKRAYTLTIPATEIDGIVDAELKKIAPQVKMPGFRPGKVPANLVKKMHGEAMQQDALNRSIQEGVQSLIAQHKLRPAMQPSVALGEDYAPGKDAEVKVELEVLPVVPAPQIEGLKLERLTVEVSDGEVDTALAEMVASNKQFEEGSADRPAERGDLVVMDFAGKVDGVAFEGGTGQDMSVEIGSGRLIPGFEDQLIGVKSGEEKTISVTFPQDYAAADLKGKDATFDLVIKDVKAPKPVEADDDFAKSLGLEGLDQLRGLLRSQVEQQSAGLTRTHMKRKLLDQLAEAHDFDVPPSMVDAEFEQIWRQLEHEAGHEADPEAALKEMEAERDDYRNIAVRRVRLGLLLSEIGQSNGVEISQNEMRSLIEQAAQQYRPEDRQRFAEYIRENPMAAAQLRAPLYEDKVVDFLFERAEVTDRTVPKSVLESEIEDDGHVHGPGCGHDHAHDEPAAEPEPAAKSKRGKKVTAKDLEPAAPEAEAAPAEPVKKAATRKAPAKKKAAEE